MTDFVQENFDSVSAALTSMRQQHSARPFTPFIYGRPLVNIA